jgi:aminobenzoyl-glutamate transport protein
MLPYTVAFFLSWTGLLVLWIVFGLPLGPGAGMYL